MNLRSQKGHLALLTKGLVCLFVAAALMLGTTATPIQAKGGYIRHRVKKGETLYRIAKRYGVSVKAIMRANGIKDPKRVRAGKVLLIPKKRRSSSKSTRPYPKNYPRSYHYSVHKRGEFVLPGKVLDMRAGLNQGLDLKVSGGIIRAAGDGKVIYRTTSMLGYSSVLILQHGGGFETVYAGKNVDWIKEKDQWVMQGEIIGKIVGPVKDEYPLHFEIRRRGQPLPALRYLKR